jgi:hypothetical protein
MATYHNRPCPTRHQTWDVIDDDRLTEYSAIEDVSDGAIRRAPHRFKLEFFNASFIRCDSSAFNADVIFFNGIGCVDCDLVVGGVTIGDGEIVILNINVYVGEDELLFDRIPDNPVVVKWKFEWC